MQWKGADRVAILLAMTFVSSTLIGFFTGGNSIRAELKKLGGHVENPLTVVSVNRKIV